MPFSFMALWFLQSALILQHSGWQQSFAAHKHLGCESWRTCSLLCRPFPPFPPCLTPATKAEAAFVSQGPFGLWVEPNWLAGILQNLVGGNKLGDSLNTKGGKLQMKSNTGEGSSSSLHRGSEGSKVSILSCLHCILMCHPAELFWVVQGLL